MKKSFFGIVTIMLLLAIVLPLSVNAATLSVDKSEMNVGDIVTVEVTTKQDVESIQFDLQFDRSKYEYVNDSAQSDLDATDSNLIADNMVRVSAFDMNQAKADTVTMKFKAIAGGTSVPFKVLGTVEIGENGETFDATEVQVKQIKGESTELNNSTQYLDGKGQAITRLPQTGGKNLIGIYGQLVAGKNIVTYALPYSDDTLSIADIKAQFGTGIEITGADNDIVGTGKEFSIGSANYTIVIYGDVNGDGRVTTADALKTRKSEEGKVAADAFEQEALDVVRAPGKDNGENTANALAQQAFVLRKQYGTQEQTIIDEYPEKAEKDLIKGIAGTEQAANNKYRYENIVVADIVSVAGSDAITEDMLSYEIKLNGALVDKNSKTAQVEYTNKGNGNFSMALYAAQAGNYEVTPIIAGINVEGGIQRGNTYSIEVAESNEITGLKLKEGSTEITGNVQVRVGKQKQLNVEFVHEYTDTKFGTTPEPFVITDVDSNKVNITADSNYFAPETVFANNVLTVKPQGQVGNATLTLAIDSFSKTINVEIQAEAKIAGISFNGTKLTDNASMEAINIYKDTNYIATDKTVKKIEKITNTEGTLVDSVFTILPVAFIDEDGDVRNTIKRKDIENNIYETEDPRNHYDLDIKYYALNDNNQYEEKNNQEDRIDAIGIALTLELVEGWLEYVNGGLTLEFTTVNGTKAVTMPVKVFEKGVEVKTENPSADEPSQDEPSQEPTTPDVDDNNNNNTGDVNKDPVEDKDETPSNGGNQQKPSDDIEKPELPDEGNNSGDDNNNEGDNNNTGTDNPEDSTRPQPSPDDDTQGPEEEDNSGSVVEEN